MSNSKMSKAGNRTGACKVAVYHNKMPDRALIVPGTNLVPMDVFPLKASDENIRILLKTVEHEQ